MKNNLKKDWKFVKCKWKVEDYIIDFLIDAINISRLTKCKKVTIKIWEQDRADDISWHFVILSTTQLLHNIHWINAIELKIRQLSFPRNKLLWSEMTGNLLLILAKLCVRCKTTKWNVAISGLSMHCFNTCKFFNSPLICVIINYAWERWEAFCLEYRNMLENSISAKLAHLDDFTEDSDEH